MRAARLRHRQYRPERRRFRAVARLVGSLGERVVVASPIYKQHFDLASGECLEAPGHSVAAWPARVFAGMVWVAL
jgi:nitrite reductase/ring-hydroxylating ferredoxin subunit